jgi:hypothetical protein
VVYVSGKSHKGRKAEETAEKDNGVLKLTREGETDIVVNLGWTAEKISSEIDAEIGKALKDLTALNYKGTVGTGATV